MADLPAIAAPLVSALKGAGSVTDLLVRRDRLGAGTGIYADSLQGHGASVVAMVRDAEARYILQVGNRRADLDDELAGDSGTADNLYVKLAPLSAANAQWLRHHFPWLRPISLRDRQTTIGFGDRLGRASAGHLAAARRYAIGPVLAQQSIRELTLTNRQYAGVVNDATFLVFQAGYTHGYGADGDHLKTMKDIDIALEAGMAMITLDQTEVLNAAAEKLSDAEVASAFTALPAEVQSHVTAHYAGKAVTYEGHSIRLSEVEAKRCTLMYWDALEFTEKVHAHLVKRRGKAFDLELSIDETTAPTLPSHHWYIIAELERRGVEVTSLAPRFIGEFQKGIDYIGDLNEFELQFSIHCAIARAHGDYKISVHSGSDKFSAFPIVGEHTRQRFHLKTAGTSWLEAVRVMTQKEPQLFRDMYAASHAGLEQALKLYHITADFSRIPDLAGLADSELPELMEMVEARQLLHISYGTLLNHKEVGPRFFRALHAHEAAYVACLDRHFTRHLEGLGVAPWS